ncbi:O-antigen ligase family protein, partial [Streptomyces sp. S6]
MGSAGRTSVAGNGTDSDRRNVSDALGTTVLAACAVWALISAGANDGRAEGTLLAVLAVAAGYAAGRISGTLSPVAVPG